MSHGCCDDVTVEDNDADADDCDGGDCDGGDYNIDGGYEEVSIREKHIAIYYLLISISGVDDDLDNDRNNAGNRDVGDDAASTSDVFIR